MSNHELPFVLTADDESRVERKLAELPESFGGTTTISMFLPGASKVLVLLTQDGGIVSWCLMPARDQGRAHELTVLMKQILTRELEIASRDVKALADAAIGRASQTARPGRALRRARQCRNDTYPGEWDCGAD
jgi:hypothetical protein